jgi:hypothetical protein
MGETLKEVAQRLKDCPRKVQLIYAFNGVGKTRLSRTFKELVSSDHENTGVQDEEMREKILYYNAFTEDLFYWDNGLDREASKRLLIHHNSFTDWVLKDEGQDKNIITDFQRYTNEKLSPRFSENYDEVSFSVEGGNEKRIDNIKISRGEENCFVWCVFYSLLKEVVDVLNIPDLENRSTNRFDDLEYIFIDDPVSSLDENHLIELAVNVAEVIKGSSSRLKFIIATHNPLFYNVLFNELNFDKGYMLSKFEDGSFKFEEKKGDSNKGFSYHLFLKQTIEKAIETNTIQKYHFTLLRNLYEKTANFLGYPKWSDLLPEDRKTYYNRIVQFTSHSTLSNEVVAEPTDAEKQIVKFLLRNLVDNRYWKEEPK